MLVKYNDDDYVAIDHITALKKNKAVEENARNYGVMVLGTTGINLTKSEYDVICKAYEWLHKGHLYDKNFEVM